MKKRIILEYRWAVALLGRHADLVNSHQASGFKERIVDIIQETERTSDVGFVKRMIVRFFTGAGDLRFIAGLIAFLGVVALAGLRFDGATIERLSKPSLDHVWVVLALVVGFFVAISLRIIANRFENDLRRLTKAQCAVSLFHSDVYDLLGLLGDESATAGKIIDRKLSALALRVVTSEKAMPEHWAHLPDCKPEEDRQQIRIALVCAKVFGLGKGQQSYYDTAKAKWRKLANKGLMVTDYCI